MGNLEKLTSSTNGIKCQKIIRTKSKTARSMQWAQLLYTQLCTINTLLFLIPYWKLLSGNTEMTFVEHYFSMYYSM